MACAQAAEAVQPPRCAQPLAWCKRGSSAYERSSAEPRSGAKRRRGICVCAYFLTEVIPVLLHDRGTRRRAPMAHRPNMMRTHSLCVPISDAAVSPACYVEVSTAAERFTRFAVPIIRRRQICRPSQPPPLFLRGIATSSSSVQQKRHTHRAPPPLSADRMAETAVPMSKRHFDSAFVRKEVRRESLHARRVASRSSKDFTAMREAVRSREARAAGANARQKEMFPGSAGRSRTAGCVLLYELDRTASASHQHSSHAYGRRARRRRSASAV